jgi:hypothetical protein
MKTKTIIKIFFIILLLLLLALGIYALVKPKKAAYENVVREQPQIAENYLYSIKYNFSHDYYIIQKEDKTFEIYHKEKLYKECPGTNCIKETDQYLEERKPIQLKEENYTIVSETLNALHNRIGVKDIDADKEEITSLERRILLALIIGDEDIITVDKDVAYISKRDDSTVEGVTFYNKYVLLDESDNKILNRIVLDLNPRIEKIYQEIKAEKEKDADLYAEAGLTTNTGAVMDLQVVFAGPHYISFMTVAGLTSQDFVDPTLRANGFVYSFAGEIKEFPAGLRENYYNKAVQVFYETPEYQEFKADLLPDWRNTFKNTMFETGNWLLNDDKVTFFIPAHLLGIVPLKEPLIVVTVTNEGDL